MVSQQLLDYIKEQLEKGSKESDIKKILLEYGWLEADVDQALSIVHPNNASLMSQLEKLELANKKSGRLIRVLVVTFLLVISLLVAAAGFYWVVRNKKMASEAVLNKKITEVKLPEKIEAKKDADAVEQVEIIDTTDEIFTTSIATSTDFTTSTAMTTSTVSMTDKLAIKCGVVELNTPEIVKTAMKKCFQDNLKTCAKAQIILTKDVGQLGGTVTSDYEIIEENASLCSVKVTFLQNPNAEWNGKEMFCDYSKTKDFEISFADITSCKGPLYELMAKGL